jgi:hypothetical protein
MGRFRSAAALYNNTAVRQAEIGCGFNRSCFAGEQVTAEPFEPAEDSRRCKVGMRIANLRLAKSAHTEVGPRSR